jgi:hypothetical protein
MNRLRQLLAAAMAASMLAFAPPSFAQDGASTDEAAEQVDATTDVAAGAADTGAPAEDDPDAAMADAEIEETPSPWSGGLMMSITAMCIGGFSAVLGIWVDRDTSRPTIFAYSMSFLILCALVVGVAQGYLDEVEGIKKDQDLERMLDMTYEIAKSSGDPALIALVEESSGVKIELEEAPAEEPPSDGDDDDAGDPAE